ncbi:MAG: tetratricopeptide repeat protein [Pseudomonadota bacterium]
MFLFARSILLPAMLAMCSAMSAAEAIKHPTTAQDLQYGETLFYYYQDDWFDSIVRLQIAKSQNRLPYHGQEAELLLGGLDLSYGLRGEASRIFEVLLTDSNADERTRNRAWFYLAKISYQRSDITTALQALAHVSGKMTRSTRTEIAQLHSLLLLQLGQNEEAIKVLQSARNDDAWSPYLAYNLGVALIKSGSLQEGADELDSIGKMSGRSDEIRLLRDKANLALGYSHLQHGESTESRTFLDRVRLEGPLSNQALLGAGWANADSNDYGRALIPWSELGKRDLTDPAVQEALLAMPYAMTRMNLHGRAVQHYNDAIAVLYEEKEKLDASINAIKNGEMLEVLEQQDLRSGSGWLQKLTVDSQSPAMRYQLTLMAEHEFQEAVKNYRDLLKLHANLQTWSDSMDAFGEMLAAREQRFSDHRPAAEQAIRANVHTQLEQRHRELRLRVTSAESTDDPVSLASAEELGFWNNIQKINRKLDGMPKGVQTAGLRERARRIKGALYWDMSMDFKPRLWQAKRQLVEIAGLLDQTAQARHSLESADMHTTTEFSSYQGRVDTRRKQVDRLLARTDKLRLAQGNSIEQLAVAELEQQKSRIDTYIVQARFSLAQTFDSALHSGTGGIE